MKAVTRTIAAAMLVMVAGLGCESTHEEGVKSDLHSQWTQVAADTETTTEAAKTVLTENKLMNVDAKMTKMDGTATGTMADGTKVKVDIEKTDNGSEVSVTVGTMGSPKMGADLAMKIKQTAEK